MRGLRPDDWRRNVWALTLTVFISFVGFQFFSPFLPLYIRELGVTDPAKIALWSGLQAAVTPAMSGILSPVFGRLADRLRRHRRGDGPRDLGRAALPRAGHHGALRGLHADGDGTGHHLGAQGQ